MKRHRGAEGVPHDVHAIEAEGVKRRGDVQGHLLDGVRTWRWCFASALASKIEEEDAETSGLKVRDGSGEDPRQGASPGWIEEEDHGGGSRRTLGGRVGLVVELEDVAMAVGVRVIVLGGRGEGGGGGWA